MINAALHAAGITKENSNFATQIPDVYAVLDGQGQWHHELGVRCDLIHVGLPEVAGTLPAAVQQAFDAMHAIEHFRDPCVRGNSEVTPDVAAACDKAYSEILVATKTTIAQGPL